MKIPKVQAYDGSLQVVDTFGGLNRAEKIREGEWNETLNLSSDNYPLLSTRQPASVSVGVDGNVIDMIDNDRLYVLYVKNGEYYLWDRNPGHTPLDIGHYGSIGTPTGLVSLAAYIIVLGANIWYNTADGTHGDINATMESPSEDITTSGMTHSYVLKLCPCESDGTELRIAEEITPEMREAWETDATLSRDGECFSIGSERLIRQRHGDASSMQWDTKDLYLRVEADGIDNDINVGDVINLSGLPTEWENGSGVYREDKQPSDISPTSQSYFNVWSRFADDPNGLREVAYVGDGFVVVKDVYFPYRVTVSETAAGSVTSERKMPDMDFVVEAQNRLWGCKYGIVDGKLINEIYASALGDFKNWRKYDGTSMASWAASVGTDGKWTGAISFNGSPMFFKENRLHKVYVSSYGAHQIRDYSLDGVADSCSKSLCEVDGRLFWVGLFGIYAFDGSIPAARISTALGHKFVEHVLEASAGGSDKHVYFYLDHDSGEVGMTDCYVYDVTRQTWNIVHNISFDLFSGKVNPTMFCPSRNCMYAVGESSGNIIDLFGNDSTQHFEKPTSWSCTSGLIGYETVEQKEFYRMDLRMELENNATFKLEIEYDSDGTWREQATQSGTGIGSVVIPVRPWRCDHFRIRLSGTGQMKLWSIAKRYRRGSDVT